MNLDTTTLGRVDYAPTFEAMQAFTAARTPDTPDALWICEHPPVYTQGLAGKADHLLNPGDIPVIPSNRGGQVTYHGPGQVVAYPLIDLQRAGYYVKEYVYRIEEAVIRTLIHFGITGHRVAGAPGIYVRLDDPGSHALLPQRPQKTIGVRSQLPHGDNRDLTPIVSPTIQRRDFLGKIAALGIKVSRNCTYHGVALNVAWTWNPSRASTPAAMPGLKTVDLSTIGVHVSAGKRPPTF
jgi:lipoyl(octanoyl) transferase